MRMCQGLRMRLRSSAVKMKPNVFSVAEFSAAEDLALDIREVILVIIWQRRPANKQHGG